MKQHEEYLPVDVDFDPLTWWRVELSGIDILPMIQKFSVILRYRIAV